MVKCGFWRATGCSFGFPTGFQLWVELHGHWELWSVGRSRAGSGFPKPMRAVPMAGVGPGPRESPSHLAGGLDQGLVLRHRAWHFALLWVTLGCLCFCHAVFLRASLHPKMPLLAAQPGEGCVCLAFAWNTHSQLLLGAYILHVFSSLHEVKKGQMFSAIQL